MGYLLGVLVIVALFAGFAAGLVIFKRSHSWCPACGTALRCLDCTGQPTAGQAREALRALGRR